MYSLGSDWSAFVSTAACLLIIRTVGTERLTRCEPVLQVVAYQHYSKAADVYSFGIILWELLTWQVPWGDLNPFQVLQNDGRRV